MAHKPLSADDFDELIRQLESLRREIGRRTEAGQALVQDLPEGRRASALNMLQYLALRSRDLRPLQDRLAHLGLSSIGRGNQTSWPL